LTVKLLAILQLFGKYAERDSTSEVKEQEIWQDWWALVNSTQLKFIDNG